MIILGLLIIMLASTSNTLWCMEPENVSLEAAQAKARYEAGFMCQQKKDYEGAISYYRSAAAQGVDPAIQAKAYLSLGDIYSGSWHRPPFYRRAGYFYDLAIRQDVDLKIKSEAEEKLRAVNLMILAAKEAAEYRQRMKANRVSCCNDCLIS